MIEQRDLFAPKRAAEPMILRPYQQAAVESVYAHLRARDDNPCVVLPTGSGKTPVLATMARDAVTLWGGRVLVLAHVKELLEQAADKLRTICPGVSVGVFSAGLGRRERRQSITVAGIQSIYKLACDFDPFNLIFIDEAHLIPPEGDGMYRQFLADVKKVNPEVRIVGLTATPFRMKSGAICAPDGILNTICHESGVRELIAGGYLSPLISKGPERSSVDTSKLSIRAGEFAADEAESLMVQHVVSACDELVEHTRDRKSCLIFCAGTDHALRVAEQIRSLGHECAIVFGDTPSRDRAETLARFKAGTLKYLANINVLTTGFDAPNVDCVALMRPTNSPGLYYQMVGRGFRLFPGKVDCLVKDFGGNVLRHGPVDRIEAKDKRAGAGKGGDAAAKECPKCHSLIACGYSVCPDCGHVFECEDKPKHDAQATSAGILSGQVATSSYAVTQVYYSVHVKQGAADDAPRTLRVDYLVDGGLLTKSEWICLEHDGWVKSRAEAWWRARSPDQVPQSIEQAVDIASAGGLAETREIVVRSVAGERFDRIIDYVLGDMPQALPAYERGLYESGDREAFAEDDIPF